MKVESLKEFEALLKICKKHGVSDIKIDNIELKLELQNLKTEQTSDKIEVTDQMTNEEILFYSSTPHGS